MPRRRTLALIAHDSKKPTLVRWARDHLDILKKLDLFATEATGARLEAEVGLDVTRLKSGPMGGDQQIGAKIAAGEIDGIIFLWDPLLPHSHDADLKALLRVAVVYDVLIACNLASARLMMSAFEDDAE
jgi:methylglyoxal synthase